MVNLTDPNTRYVEEDLTIDQYMIYSALRGGFEEIGVEVTDADENKGIVKGNYLGNRKKPFKVQFKKMKKGGFAMRVSHKFKLKEKNFDRRDIRDLPLDKYDEAIIVKFWDAVYNELDLGLAPGFGDLDATALESNKIEELKRFFGNQLTILLNDDRKLDTLIKEINQNQRDIKSKYKWELRTIEQNARWPQKMIYAIEMFMDEAKSRERTIVLTVNSVDLKTVTKLPIMINMFIAMPRALPKELNMSYKCQWTAPAAQMDDVSQKIIHHMNFEMSSLEKRLHELYDDEYLYHFEFKETFEDKGQNSTIEHDQLLLYPINVIETMNPTSDDQRFLLVMKYFLNINRRGNHEGFVPIINCLKIMSDLIKSLKRFYIATEEDKQKEQEKAKRKKDDEDAQKSAIRKCMKCGWLLSEGAISCPMCGSNVTAEKKETFGIQSGEYDKSSALLGAKEKAYSDKLLSAFDSALQDWGDAESKISDSVKEVFLGFLNQPLITNKIEEIIEDEERIKEIVHKAFNINEEMHSSKCTLIGKYLMQLSGFKMDWLYVTLEILKAPKEHIFPVLINYVIRAPYNKSKISYFLERAEKRWDSDVLRWQIDVGDDTPLVKALKEENEDLNTTLTEIYSIDSRNQYIEPILNKRGKIKGVEYSVDLYPLIRIEPFYLNEIRPGNIVILRQFLDYEQSSWISFSSVLNILEQIYKTIEDFQQEYSAGDFKEGLDLAMLDKKIKESKYSYKQKMQSQKEASIDGIPTSDNTLEKEVNSSLNDIEKKEGDLGFEVDSLLGSDKDEDSIFDEDYIEKTTFYNKLPADFSIDKMMNDKEIDNTVYQLQIEIENIMELAEQEISSLANGQTTYTSCQAQINTFIEQIRQKQIKIRAYEYEKHRIRLDRLEIA